MQALVPGVDGLPSSTGANVVKGIRHQRDLVTDTPSRTEGKEIRRIRTTGDPSRLVFPPPYSFDIITIVRGIPSCKIRVYNSVHTHVEIAACLIIHLIVDLHSIIDMTFMDLFSMMIGYSLPM